MVSQVGRKAVLVYPRFLDETFWSFSHSLRKYIPRTRFGTPKRSLPPLGLMGLFGRLKPHYEEVVLVDRNVDPRPLEGLIADADHVYMGGMIAQERGFLEDAAIVKAQKKRLIAGGTVVDEGSPLMGLADHLVENEAEGLMDDLLQGLVDGTAEKYYRGGIPTPQMFWQPDFSSIHLRDYTDMALQVSRGCPEACEFCDITTRFGQKPRVTPIEQTEASLQQLFNLGWRGGIFIVDDNFIGSPKGTIRFLKQLYDVEGKIGYRATKYTELTMRLADESEEMDELRDLLRANRFNRFFIGVETNNVAALRETRKEQNLRGERSMLEKLDLIAENTGAGLMAGMIHGFDHDSEESVDSLIDFINASPIPVVMAGLLTALHHTKLEDRLKREGRFRELSSANNTDGTINFIPYGFSARQAEADYVRILKGVYSEEAYFGRVLRSLELLNPVDPNTKVPLGEAAYSVSRILTKDHAWTYWKYLPKAHAIARDRFGLGTPGYTYVMGDYITRCAQFTHFKAIADRLEAEVRKRKYEPWQQYSWKELQESPVERVEVLEPVEAEPSLSDSVRMRLANGYEYVGTRLEALAHFIEPHLKEGLRALRRVTPRPTIDHFFETELGAYLKAHVARPQILGELDFKKVEARLREALADQRAYFDDMRHMLGNAMSGMTLQDMHS